MTGRRAARRRSGRGTRRAAHRHPPRRQVATASLLVAALAFGRAVETWLPDDEFAARPFERSGVIGDPLELRWGTVDVDDVAGSTQVSTAGAGRVTGGVYLVVTFTFTASREPQVVSYVAIRDPSGRTFRSGSERNPYRHGGAAQPGVPRRLTAAIEVPADAVAGSVLVVATQPNEDNHRHDDIAVIDLGLTEDDAAAWASDTDVVTVDAPLDGR